jgi:hemerythrin-like domain-containing protein
MTSDAVTLIKNDHRLLEDLFAQLQAGKGDRQKLVDEITARLTAHAEAEEQQVYPAIKKADPGEADGVDHAYTEHAQAMHLLRKVRNLTGSPHFDEAVNAFVAAVKHHVDEEESDVLPALQRAVDAATLERLGAAFTEDRAAILRRAGFDPGDDLGAVPGDDATDLTAATRDELYEMAKQAHIPGRSSMNKDELIRALRDNG